MSLTKVQINLGTSGNLSGSRSLASSSLASRITTAEDELGNTLISSSAQLADDISGSFGSQRVGTSDSPTFNAITVGTATITGTLTAQEVHTEFESASILFTSGSTQFGNSSDDVHDFKGNTISGSATSTGSFGSVVVPGNVDVDGTTNLDNTDIDGTLTVDGGNIVFNEDSADQDFRVESNDNTHMFFVDGGNNRIGIGVGATPAFATLDIDAPGATNADNLDQSVDRATLRVRYRTDETDDGMFFGGLGSSAGYIQGVIDASDDNSSQAGKTIAINPYGGNVGIGKSSIDMARDGRTALEIGAEGTLYSNTTSAQGGITGLGHNYYYDSSNQAKFMRANEEAATMEIYNGGFYFYSDSRTDQSADANASVTSKLTILADGKVGIGFTAPETTLQVSGSIGSKLGTGGFLSIIRKSAAITAGDMLGAVRFGGEETDQQVGGVIQAKCDGVWATNDLPTRLEFYTAPDGSGDAALRMTIKNTGRVGIGTDAPDGTLDVAIASGTCQQRIKSISSGDAILDLVAGGANDTQIRFYEDTTFKWRVRQNAGGSDRFEIINASDVGVSLGYGGNSWGTQSDERIKENLIEITDATEKLNQLRCINYNYTFDKEREHLGLIAQEVQKFYPQIVSGDPSKEIEEIVNEDGIVDRKNVMSIEYSSLIPVLVKSIQELTKRIEELEK